MRDEQTYNIIGAAMEVHHELGHGFLEAVYQHALAEEFSERHVPFQRECRLPVSYKGKILDCYYQADFICYDEIVVEIKAINKLTGNDQAQVINYLKASGFQRGLLFNFGTIKLDYQRIVYDYDPEQGNH